MKQLFKYIIWLIVLVVIIGGICIHFIAPYAILQPQKQNLAVTPSEYNLLFENVNIPSFDSTNLVGYHIKSNDTTTKGVMILLHGIGSCKEYFLGTAKQLAAIGIASYVLDNRAHGKSGGKFVTYGFKEKKDVSAIVQEIKKQYPNTPIGIWGQSLGGAIAIQALEYDKAINFGIIESTFTDLNQIVFDYKKRISGVGIQWVANYVLARAGKIANFNPEEVKPIQSVATITQPVFIGHGTADKNIDVKYGKALHKALKSVDKQLVLVEGGGHNNIAQVGGEEYQNKIANFIKRNISP